MVHTVYTITSTLGHLYIALSRLMRPRMTSYLSAPVTLAFSMTMTGEITHLC